MMALQQIDCRAFKVPARGWRLLKSLRSMLRHAIPRPCCAHALRFWISTRSTR